MNNTTPDSKEQQIVQGPVTSSDPIVPSTICKTHQVHNRAHIAICQCLVFIVEQPVAKTESDKPRTKGVAILKAESNKPRVEGDVSNNNDAAI